MNSSSMYFTLTVILIAPLRRNSALRKSQQFFFLLLLSRAQSTKHTQNRAVFRTLQNAKTLNVFISKASKLFMKHYLPRLPSVETSANSPAQVCIFCTKSFWSGVKLVKVTRKCFSRRLINGMGKLLYTTSFSAITINLSGGK